MTGPAYPACSQRRSDALWDCEHEPRRTIRALLGPGRRSQQAPARCRVPWSSHRNPRPASCPPGLLPRGAPADRVQRFTASRKYRRGSGGGAPIPGPGTAAAQPRKAPTTTRGGARRAQGSNPQPGQQQLEQSIASDPAELIWVSILKMPAPSQLENPSHQADDCYAIRGLIKRGRCAIKT